MVRIFTYARLQFQKFPRGTPLDPHYKGKGRGRQGSVRGKNVKRTTGIFVNLFSEPWLAHFGFLYVNCSLKDYRHAKYMLRVGHDEVRASQRVSFTVLDSLHSAVGLTTNTQ
jgi:hypothetical protein